MSEPTPRRGRTRTITVAALLGVFVAAVLVAVGVRLLPGPLSRLVKKRPGNRS